MSDRLSPSLLVQAYSRGLFPMAESRDDSRLFWVDPEERGVLPIDGFHVPKRLRRTVKQDRFRVTHDLAFEQVIQACSELDQRRGRFDTWINIEIVRAYVQLFQLGHAHSIECWQDGRIVGGLYGVSIGAAFFGESMFSIATDASKLALWHLSEQLADWRFALIDCQVVSPHLLSLGAYALSRKDFLQQLQQGVQLPKPAGWKFAPKHQGNAAHLPQTVNTT